MTIPFIFVLLVIPLAHCFSFDVNNAIGLKGPINTIAGPCKIALKKVEFCPPEVRGKHLTRFTGKIIQTKESSQPLYYGNLETLEDFTNDYRFHVAVYTWNKATGWSTNPFNFNLGKACDALNTIFKDTVSNLEAHEVNHSKICPSEKGNMTFVGVPTVYDMGKFAPLPYGKYRSDSIFTLNKETHGCMRTEVDIIPIAE